MIGVAVGTMALVVVLSVFNGLEGLIKGLYASFDADLKVMPVLGKSFAVDEAFLSSIERLDGIAILTEVIEDNALVRYGDHQVVATVKGVSDNFLDQNRFERGQLVGEMNLGEAGKPQAILGRGSRTFC